MLAIGHFEVPALQLDHLGRAFEREGAEVRRATRARTKAGKVRELATALAREARWSDVVVNQCHGHLNLYQSLAVAAAARLAGRPVVLLYYGGTLEAELRRHPRAYRTLFRSVDAIVVASGFIGGVIGREGFGTREIRHLVFEDEWRPRLRREATPRFLSVRGYHPIYNPMMILRAFARIHEERPDARLTMVGRGPLRERVEAEARRLALPVEFRAGLPQSELAAVLDAHDVFLNASDYDNQPVCLIEAMTAGLPIVTTDAGGIPFMMKDGEAGHLVARGDDAAMARAALSLLADPDRVARMSARGLELAKDYQWSALRSPWADLLTDVTTTRGRRS